MGCSGSKPKPAGLEKATNVSKGGPTPAVKDAKLLDRYTLGKVLGQGAFGIVYSCRQKGTNVEYAVKMIDQVETPVAEIKQEVEMLQRLAHPCVVKIHGVFYEKVFVCLVLDLYKGGDLIEGMQLHWKNKGMISVSVCQNLTKMMFQGVDWLHKNSIIHRDLKGDNYLQDRPEIHMPSCRIYLSDFGTVREVPPNGGRFKNRCGTKTYWSPEFYSQNYGLPVDIWALGVVLFGLITGRFPFKTEEDVRTKAIKYPSRVGDAGVDFLKRTLDRDEPARITSKEALIHAWLSSIKSAAEDEVEQMEENFKAEIRELGANAGIQERRLELVERLQDAQLKKRNSGPRLVTKEQVTDGFEVYNEAYQTTTKFEWWAAKAVKKSKFYDESKASIIKDESSLSENTSQTAIKESLLQHSIDPNLFGKGQAKKFPEFVFEVQSGQARLMLDASKHKCLVRVVDVVLLRIVHGNGVSKKYLINTAQTYPDGRVREDSQIPGTKKMPFENGVQAAERLIKERLAILDGRIKFNFALKEVFEEDEDSPSYPGVRTVYRKEIYEGHFNGTDPRFLAQIGLQKNGEPRFEQEDGAKYKRTFTWFSEKQCAKLKIQLRAPEDETHVSALVMPPVGYEEEELKICLQSGNVDIAQFGKDGVKTLAEFSEELVKGESTLMKQPDGSLVRVVDVVILKISNKQDDTLVEVSQKDSTGALKEVRRLPGAKRRIDENPFWAAQRVLSKVLKINGDFVRMDPDNVQLVEEQTCSKTYGGLPTLYRRRIIPCKVVNVPNE